jgi:sigma-B regulation protein RsbU (phosphoserine phosphatase)
VEARVARSTSGGRPGNSTNGRSKQSSVQFSEALEDGDARASHAHTLADADQTASDGDQTLSDVDQTSSDSDQTSADCDQVAADRDQAASDQDLAAGGDREGHDVSQGIRERSAVERELTGGRRVQTAQARLRDAEQRDAVADARDVAALARDQAAAARDLALAQVGLADAQADGARALTGDLVVRAAGQRRRAAQQRATAAEHRVIAAEDRLMAERDRERGARERQRSLVDREMLVLEIQREHALRGEALGHQHRAEALARTLQRSLSPPSLPIIAGLDVAVHYEPSAPEDVGGDFYDLFPLAAGRSGFFLGDVCGKGPEAAAITSLARYTMRTAAMLREEPDAILMDLNAALLMHTAGPMQTCTAVYGQIDMTTGATAIMLAVAGHPPPLIVREDGSVQTTAAHGTLLGAVHDPSFQTCEVKLELGDAIVICSDGIFDTVLHGIRVDEQHVAELLSGSSGASAQDLVNRLISALEDVDRPLRDDIAVMTLQRTPMA